MFSNNLKIAWRHFVKNRLFSMLNVTGLSTGLCAVIFILLWVQDERSIDGFHQNDDRLYQVLANMRLPDGIHTQEETPGLLAGSLPSDYPEIEKATVIKKGTAAGIISHRDKHLRVAYQYIDSNFFHVFSFALLTGDQEHVLDDKHAVLISAELATTLFGSPVKSMGQLIKWQDEPDNYMVTGVFAKPTAHSSMQFDALFNFELAAERNPDGLRSWLNSNPLNYVVLRKGSDLPALNRRIDHYTQTKSDGSPIHLFLAKYSERYLHHQYDNGQPAGGRIEYVRLFSFIAAFILLIACINFMNLSTAKATSRAKEMRIKKMAGASRAALTWQHIAESMLMVFFSILLAVVLNWLLMPWFNRIIGKTLSIPWRPGFAGALLILLVVTGLVAGSYPAFYLSGFRPALVLKGSGMVTRGAGVIRRGLVVFQFTLSVVFIIAVITIYRQMNLIQTVNLGYNKDNVISFANEGSLQQSFSAFMNDVKKIPGVAAVSSFGADMAGTTNGSTEQINWEGRQPGDTVLCQALLADYGAFNLLAIPMQQGRTFSRAYGSDSLSIILNEAAVAAMNMKQPIGKAVTVWGSTYHIIGVSTNFHYESLHEKVKPCFIRCAPAAKNILVKIKAGTEQKTIASLASIWQAYNPSFPFAGHFMDETYQAMYQSDQRLSALSGFFAGLAIIISCLGLFGLAAYTAEKRQKEIGIRKVVGASISSLLVLLSRDFIKLVALAILIAFPLSWWTLHEWLNRFAYRVSVNGWDFAIAGLAVLLVTILTVSIQSIKAALSNPATVLRTE